MNSYITPQAEAYANHLAIHEIAMRFPVPYDFVQTVVDDCSGDLDLAQRWLAACALSGRYFTPGSLKILKLSLLGEVQ